MGNTMPLADQVYILQSNVIKELAAQGSCVILGRCGDYVLRDRPNVLRVFIYAPLEERIARAKARPGVKDLTDRQWEVQLAKHDRAAPATITIIPRTAGGEAKNYDLCLNAALGQDVCAQLIVDAARAMAAKTRRGLTRGKERARHAALRQKRDAGCSASSISRWGCWLLTMPQTSLLWICYAFGAVVLITGIVCLIQYARIRGSGFAALYV